jgi:hypothetical protein
MKARRWNFDPNYLDADLTNMYGFTRCPKCNKHCRCSFVRNPEQVDCDDCGFVEPIITREEPRAARGVRGRVKR